MISDVNSTVDLFCFFSTGLLSDLDLLDLMSRFLSWYYNDLVLLQEIEQSFKHVILTVVVH
jgi:hypothetical protein